MIIIGSQTDLNWLQSKCDGRCAEGQWCIFADGKNADGCPVDNSGDFIVVKKNRFDMLEVVE